MFSEKKCVQVKEKTGNQAYFVSTERMYENETNDNHMDLACNTHQHSVRLRQPGSGSLTEKSKTETYCENKQKREGVWK